MSTVPKVSKEEFQISLRHHTRQPYDDGLRLKFMHNCVYYILSLKDQHFLHEFPDVCELFEFFSCKNPDEGIQRMYTILRMNLSLCSDCITAFHACWEQFLSIYPPIFGEESVGIIKGFVNQFNLDRQQDFMKVMIASFESAETPERHKQIRRHTFPIIHEVLIDPTILTNAVLDKLFVQIMNHAVQFKNLAMRGQIKTGFLYLALHEDKVIREWALTCLTNTTSKYNLADKKDVEPVLSYLFNTVKELYKLPTDEPAQKLLKINVVKDKSIAWYQLTTILRSISTTDLPEYLKLCTTSPDMLIITSFLKNEISNLWERLAFFEFILQSTPCSWIKEKFSTEIGYDLVDMIYNSPMFEAITTENPNDELLYKRRVLSLSWITHICNFARDNFWLDGAVKKLLLLSSTWSRKFQQVLCEMLVSITKSNTCPIDTQAAILAFFQQQSCEQIMASLYPIFYQIIKKDLVALYKNRLENFQNIRIVEHQALWKGLDQWPIQKSDITELVSIFSRLAFAGKHVEVIKDTRFWDSLCIATSSITSLLENDSIFDLKTMLELFSFNDRKIHSKIRGILKNVTGQDSNDRSLITFISQQKIDAAIILELAQKMDRAIEYGYMPHVSIRPFMMLLSNYFKLIFPNKEIRIDSTAKTFWLTVFLLCNRILANLESWKKTMKNEMDSADYYAKDVILTIKNFSSNVAAMARRIGDEQRFLSDWINDVLNSLSNWLETTDHEINLLVSKIVVDTCKTVDCAETLVESNRLVIQKIHDKANNSQREELWKLLNPRKELKRSMFSSIDNSMLRATKKQATEPSSSFTEQLWKIMQKSETKPSLLSKSANPEKIIHIKQAKFQPSVPAPRKPEKKSSLLGQLKEEVRMERRKNEIKHSIPETATVLDRKRYRESSPQPTDEEPERERRSIKRIEVPLDRRFKLGQPIGIPNNMAKESKTAIKMEQFFDTILHWTLDTLEPQISIKDSQEIPLTFANPLQYIKAFEPLLMIECQTQFAQELKHVQDKESFVLYLENIQIIDTSHEVKFSMTDTDYRKENWNENSFLCLTDHSGVHILVFVKSVQKKQKVYSLTCKLSLTGDNVKNTPNIRPQTKWDAKLVMSLTTYIREYHTLVKMGSYQMLPNIINPSKTSNFMKPDRAKIDHYTRKLGVNESQAEALYCAVNQKLGFVLIQGPPGTGKTRTLLAIVSALQIPKEAIAIPTNFPAHSKMDQYPGRVNKRLLICAPSNAAIDEITRRLMHGILDYNGKVHQPNIVRIGNASSIHNDVISISLDALVEKHFANRKDSMSETASRLDKAKEQREVWRQKEVNDRPDPLIATHIGKLTSEIRFLQEKLAEEQRNNSSDIEKEKAKYRQSILLRADIVLSTLSGSGHDCLAELRGCTFETVIIDEACQAVELSTLIPLRYGCSKCILVGDPQQLPPTIKSQGAIKLGYDRSLFQRLLTNNPETVCLLKTQYRMHPEISIFPSKQFYKGLLKDSPAMMEERKALWHQKPAFKPFIFLDVSGREEKSKYLSTFNRNEVKVCVTLIQLLAQQFPNIKFGHKIGIISFYKEQIYQLKRAFRAQFGDEILNYIDINTVDGFQGQEKDIIILSCVRASRDSSVGFLSDRRRMNVALTRARYSLIVLGNRETLYTDPLWKSLILNAQDRNLIQKAKVSDVPQNISYKNLLQE
ncbi:DEAD-box type RNA helicase [Terramyces sp. JEL0728]|nr:DEAD-box type RNA helicase [Terramyces sp. JEL0728]